MKINAQLLPFFCGFYLIILFDNCVNKNDPDPILVSYHDITIRQSQFRDSYYPQLAYGIMVDSDSSRLAYAHQMVSIYYSAQKARNSGLNIDTSNHFAYQARRNELILRELMKKEITSRIPDPSDSLLRLSYQKSNFQYRALLINEETQQAADTLHQQIIQGTSFEEILQTHPDMAWVNPSLDSLPWLKWGDLDPLLETELYRLLPGQISQPVHTLAGWFLIKLVQIKANPLMTEEDYQSRKRQLASKWKRLEEGKQADHYIMEEFEDQSIQIRKEAFQLIKHFLAIGQDIGRPGQQVKQDDMDTLRSLDHMIKSNYNMVLARSEDFELTIGEFIQNFINIPKSMKTSSALQSVQCAFRDQFLVEKAISSNLHLQPLVRHKLDNFLNEFDAAKYSNYIMKKTDLQPGELENYYERHKEKYPQSVVVHGYYQHFAQQNVARDFYQRSASLPPESLVALMKAFSWEIHPSRTQKAKDIQSLLALSLSSSILKTLTEPIGWNQGFTLFWLKDYQTRYQPLREIVTTIRPMLQQEKYQQMMNDSVYHPIEKDMIKIDTVRLLQLDLVD